MLCMSHSQKGNGLKLHVLLVLGKLSSLELYGNQYLYMYLHLVR